MVHSEPGVGSQTTKATVQLFDTALGHVFYMSQSVATAFFVVSSRAWTYMLYVISTEEWPRSDDTILTSVFFAISWVAKVCLSVCIPHGLILARFNIASKVRVKLSIVLNVPSA